MQIIFLTASITLISALSLLAQPRLVDVENKTFKTTKKIEFEGQSGYLEVPENRNDPDSRNIRFKYVWLKSLAEKPEAPVVFIEGGGGLCTWQAEDPEELTYWIELLEVSDLIFIDRRGEGDDSFIYVWDEAFPKDFFVTESAANAHYATMTQKSLATFEGRGVDVRGYNIEEEARDVNELMTALGIDKYSIFGFSFGSHIGMTAMTLFPDRIERAVLAGSDAPNQAFNFPRYLDQHVDIISEMVASDEIVSKDIPDFKALVHKVMKKLEDNPVEVDIKNPITREDIKVKIGAFGLGLILRLDIDDFNDIPVLPRLFYSIDQGDYSILTWFVQRRVVFSLALAGTGTNQYLASGVGETRWQQIEREAQESIFGNVVNLLVTAPKDIWPENELSFDPSVPMQSDIPTLFITGTLDCRTPVAQVEETMKGFSNAQHIKVENAGHEQAHWDADVFDIAIPAFLKNQKVPTTNVYYKDVEFIKVKGKAKGHPSLR
ncbi:MAG: alpha/beta hydrolase [Bacteroidota bacterium]